MSALIHSAKSNGVIHGLAAIKGVQVSVISFFADNNILFCKTMKEEWRKVKGLLNIYEKGSGKLINNQKFSTYFSSNTLEDAKIIVLQDVGGVICGNYDKYLGLLALVGRLKYNTFQWLKDRVWQKVTNWKNSFLSQAGREILIKIVFQTLSVYYEYFPFTKITLQ